VTTGVVWRSYEHTPECTAMGCGHRKLTRGPENQVTKPIQGPYHGIGFPLDSGSAHLSVIQFLTGKGQGLFNTLFVKLFQGGSHGLPTSIDMKMKWCPNDGDTLHLCGSSDFNRS